MLNLKFDSLLLNFYWNKKENKSVMYNDDILVTPVFSVIKRITNCY